MPSLHSLLIFTLAAAVMNISPGPSNLYVMSRSLAQGARAGLVAALGLATGSLFHVTVTALGLSVVLRYSPALYAVVKLVGAAYLILLGLRLLLSKGTTFTAAASGNRRPHGRIFRESILVEILNPKTALFFLAFLPQFADPGAGPLAPQLLLLGGIVTLTAIPCDAFVAFAAGAAANALARRPLYGRLQKWLSGSILVGLGAYVAASERPWTVPPESPRTGDSGGEP